MPHFEPIMENDAGIDEINLIDLFLVLLKRKKMVMGIVFLVCILSIGFSIMQPNVYTATARILPPQETGRGVAGLLSEAGGALGGLAGSLVPGRSPADVFVGIMQSRSVASMLAQGFDLKKLYEAETLEETYESLAKRTRINIATDTQIISVTVEDEDPQRSADMANAYVAALDKVNRTVNVTEGGRKRRFLEERLTDVKDDLIKAETNLKLFQEKHKLVAIDAQAKAAIESAAKIRGEIIVAETELEVLKQFGTEKQNEAIMLKSKIDELKNQLSKIESGNPEKEENDPMVSFKELPALGLQLARLMREAKIEEEVFKLITTQYELATIEEAKDVNTIQVLDRALPPDRKSGPKRALIVILSTMVAFFLAVFLAFFLEFLSRLKENDPQRYEQLANHIRFRSKS